MTPSTSIPVKLSQQALNLVRQIVMAVGWAKSVQDIYLGGQLLEEVLPQLDHTDWVKTDLEVKGMTKIQRLAYRKQDDEWASKEVKFTLNSRQKDVILKAFDHVATTGSLGPSPYLTEIIKVFDYQLKD